MVKAAEQLIVAELKALEQIKGVLGAQIGGHVVAVARIAVQPAHVPHLELGAVRPCGLGGINQLKRGGEITVVVVADLGDEEAGRHRRCGGADLKSIGGASGHGDDAAMAVEQRQRNDPGIELGAQITGAGALGGRAAGGIHGGSDRPVQVDLAALGNPAAEVTVGENPLEDAAFGDNEDQPGLVGRDLAERKKHRVFGEDNELGIPLNQDASHRCSAAWVESVAKPTSGLCRRSAVQFAMAVGCSGARPRNGGRHRSAGGTSGMPGRAAPGHCSNRQWRWRLLLPSAVG